MSSLFDRLAAEEEHFFSSQFMCPVLAGQSVRVRIAGIILNLKVQPKKFQGWGVFRCIKQHTAKFVKEPTLSQRQEYLNLFPKFSLVVCRNVEGNFFGVPAVSSSNYKVKGQVPISLPEEIRLFDTVDVRWDGVNFWFEGQSSFRTSKIASELRDLLVLETNPDKVDISGMTQEERLAYRLAFDAEVEAKRDKKEDRLKDAVTRAGGVFHGYVERGNTYTIEMSVDGERFHPVVNSDTLQVSNAGICLSGTDNMFDLQSLVTVFREGQGRSLIVRYD